MVSEELFVRDVCTIIISSRQDVDFDTLNEKTLRSVTLKIRRWIEPTRGRSELHVFIA